MTARAAILVERAQIGAPADIGHRAAANSGSSATLTTTGAILSTDIVVVAVAINDSSSITVSGISDGTNTYSKFTSVANGITDYEIWFKVAPTGVGSGATLTVTFSGAAGGGQNEIAMARITNARASDVSGTGTATGSAASAATGVLGTINEIVIGFAAITAVTATYTTSAGFTNISTDSASVMGGSILDYQIVVNNTSSVTYNPAVSGTSLGRAGAIAVAFKGY